MSDGRTAWYPEDARWLSWERVMALGEEFGSDAIAVLCVVKCEAKLQNNGWRVKVGWRALARDSFIEGGRERVRAIVERAGEIGLLDDLELDELTFTCRVSGMAASERRARDAARKKDSRGREPSTQADVTDADACGQVRTRADTADVSAEIGPREEERRGEKNTAAPGGAAHKPSEREHRRGSRSRTANTESLPGDLPESLHPAAHGAHTRLLAIWAERGGTRPSLRGTGLAIRRFPDRDHAGVVAELEQWALAGRGARQAVKNWTSTLANFLERAPAGAPTRPSRDPAASAARQGAYDPDRPLDDLELDAYARMGIDLPNGATVGQAVEATEAAA